MNKSGGLWSNTESLQCFAFKSVVNCLHQNTQNFSYRFTKYQCFAKITKRLQWSLFECDLNQNRYKKVNRFIFQKLKRINQSLNTHSNVMMYVLQFISKFLTSFQINSQTNYYSLFQKEFSVNNYFKFL